MAKATSVAECYLRLYEGGGGEINMSCALSFQSAVIVSFLNLRMRAY